jgi:HSP20 family protein
MSLLRMNPLREFDDIQRNMSRLFNTALSPLFRESERGFSGGQWAPSVDVYETEKEIVFDCELPGFEKDQVHLSVEGGRLTISGERKADDVKGRNYHNSERWYGSFQRTFLLPTSVETDKIGANLKNGILRVTLPKKDKVRPRQIPVSVE